MRTLFRNIRIFDGTANPARPGTVLVEGNRIAAVAYAPEALTPAPGDRIIDGGGTATLMPGMVEAHAHLTWGSSVEKIYHQFILPRDELKIAAWRNARVLLDHGFTSAYSAGGLADGIEPELAAAIAAGETPGPRLLPSSIERSPDADDAGDIFNGRGPEAMTGFVAHCAASGAKIVKLMISGEDALVPGSAQNVCYTPAEMAAAQSSADAAGLWLTAHCYWPEAIHLALNHDVRVLYHCSMADAASIDAMAAKKDAIFYAPGPGVSVAALEASPPPHIDMSAMKTSATERLALEAKLVPALKARGVRILIGGDYGFPFNPNGRNARDIALFVELYGFTPLEALAAATGLGGELMGLEVGQIRAGYLADLLLVDGDPTVDVAILQDADRLIAIIKDGAFHKAPASAETVGA